MSKIMIVGGVPGSLIHFRGDLINEWLALGHKVTALAAPAIKNKEEKIIAMGVDFKPIPLDRDGTNPIKDLVALFSLKRIIQSEKPDVIFAYTVKPIIFSALSVNSGSNVKMYFLITGLGYAFTGNSYKQLIIRSILKIFYRFALKRSQVIFFQNEDDYNLFKNLNILSENVEVIIINGSGVNIDYYRYSEPMQKLTISFLLIGRLLKSKGIKEYAEAAKIIKARHKNVSFKLIGPFMDKPDSIDSEDLALWQADQSIEYLGPKDDVRPYLEESDVYVLPSYREGTPRSVLEAMATGRPIITTETAGCRETVQLGVNGFLVPIKDSVALADAMEKFIIAPDIIINMGKASRKIVEEKYDVRKVNQKIIEGMDLKNL